MLFTVFVDRLLFNKHSQHTTECGNNYAIALQLLDFPLIVLRGSAASDADDVVSFGKGKAAVLTADENEIRFLVSQVPTKVLLLNVSIQSQHPRLIATGNVPLQGCTNAAISKALCSQSVVLHDARQQPVACVELYASLHDDNAAAALPAQQLSSSWASFAASPLQVSQHQQTHQLSHALAVHVQPQPSLYNNNGSLRKRGALPVQLQPPVLTYSPQRTVQDKLSSSDFCRTADVHVAPQFSIDACEAVSGSKLGFAGQSSQPAKWQKDRKQHGAVDGTAGMVLQHKRLPENAATSRGNRNQEYVKSKAAVGDHEDQNRTPNSNKRIVSRSTVMASAARAKQILSGMRPDSASPTKQPATVRCTALRSPQKSAVYGFWDRVLQKMSPKKVSHKYSPAKGAGFPNCHQEASQGGRRWQGLRQLKQQQVQRRQQQQQCDAYRPGRSVVHDDHDDAQYSDVGVEIDDISCSLTAVLDDVNQCADTVADVTAEGMDADVADGQLRTVVQDAALADGWDNSSMAAAQWHYELHQPLPPAACSGDRHCESPPQQHCLPKQQQQQHPHNSSRDIAPLAVVDCAALPAMPAPSGSCTNCAATLTAAAQLLQASQAAAATAAAVSANQQVQQPQRQQGGVCQGSVSPVTSIVWELVTLMSMRAVLSQAVSGMAEQMSGVVSQAMQKAVAAAVQTAACPWLGAPAAAGQQGMPTNSAPAAAFLHQWTPMGLMGSAGLQQAVQEAVKQEIQQCARSSAVQPHREPQAVPPDEQQQQQLTPQQLQQQQEELQKQFQQLEALLVVRDDTSSCSSSSGSSGHSSRRHKHSRNSSHVSSRGSEDDAQHVAAQRRYSAHASDADVDALSRPGLQRYRSWSVRSSGSDTAGGDRSPPGASNAGGNAAGNTSGTISGMVVRLKRGNSDRMTSPLSRNSSAAGDRSLLGSLDGTVAFCAGAAVTAMHSTLQTNTAAVTSDVCQEQQLAATISQPSAYSKTQAEGDKPGQSWLSLPPLARAGPTTVPASATAGGAGGGGSSGLLQRRNVSVASVDTSYNYEDDFESPSSSSTQLSPAQEQQQPPAASAAAGASLALLNKLPPATAQTQQHFASASSTPVIAGSSSNSNVAPSGWRNSLKMDRKGSELPEIPEIPEVFESDNGSDHEPMHEGSAMELHSETSSIGLTNSIGGKASMHRQQYAIATATEGKLVNGTAVASSQVAHITKQTSVTYQSNGTSNPGDTLDMLADSVMEEMLPPGAANGALVQRSNSMSRSYQSATSVSQEWPATITGSKATGHSAVSRTMAAALPSNSRPVQITAQQQQQQPSAASSNSHSYGSRTAAAGGYGAAVEAMNSVTSIDSANDDLLASSDLAISSHITTEKEASSRPQQLLSVDHTATMAPVVQGALGSSVAAPNGTARASQARRVSNYSDVSFLSDDEDESLAAGKSQQLQKQLSKRSTRRTESGLSYMSSLDGSDIDIDYSTELAAPATAARQATRHAAGMQQQRPQTQGRQESAHVDGINGRHGAASRGVQGSSGAARSAADVFYNHVSGTPGWSH